MPRHVQHGPDTACTSHDLRKDRIVVSDLNSSEDRTRTVDKDTVSNEDITDAPVIITTANNSATEQSAPDVEQTNNSNSINQQPVDSNVTSSSDDAIIPLHLRMLARSQVWWGKVIERFKEADEVNRIALVLSGVLALIACMAATQSLGLLVASRIVSMKSPQWPMVSIIVSSCMSVLAYLPVILWIPGMMDTLRTDSWLGKPVWKLGKAKATALVISVTIALIMVIQFIGRAFTTVHTGSMKSNAGSFNSGAIIKMALLKPSPLLVTGAIIIIILTVIIAPFCEELLFRGILGKAILDSAFVKNPDGVKTKWRQACACIVSGLVFGLMHLVVSASSQQAILTVVSMTVMGTVLTIIDDEAKSIRPSIMIHALYNAIVLSLLVMKI